MTLSLIIAIALAVPVLLLLVLYAFSKSIPWLGARPRLHAGLEMVIGAMSVVVTIIDARAELTRGDVLPLMLGVAFFAGGLHRWFRGTRVQFE